MRVLFLNPPHKASIVRRYGCSYNSPGHLFPPLELCSGATAARDWNTADVAVIDAVAQGLGPMETSRRVRSFSPDLIVSIVGFDSLHEDISFLGGLGPSVGAKTVCFGYLPSLFPKEILGGSSIDFLIMGELEETLSELIGCMEGHGKLGEVAGLAWKRNGRTVVNNRRPRISDLDRLPIPDRGLIDNSLYSMPFFGRPFTTVQASRGCQFQCTYCTHFEGRELKRRSTENIMAELNDIRSRGITHVRFMDNNFTSPSSEAKKLCRAMIEARLGLTWSCLTRADCVDEELASLMAEAGCRTVFIGVESGSDNTLRRYKKGYFASDAESCVRKLRANHMETVGWFIFGAPWEKEADFLAGVSLAKRLRLDYAIASVLSYFPGTELFADESERLDFTLMPFRVIPKDRKVYERGVSWEKRFYKSFYMSPSASLGLAKRAVMHPRDAWIAAKGLIQYIYSSKKGDFL